ncbi:hypothetical protein Tco_1336019 [Tanacetum coccineum]
MVLKSRKQAMCLETFRHKIHDVIKKEVEKLLDAGLIYPISDSPWVSPVHCVPKKGGMTVVRISQKSQENSQKQANTDTRIRRVQKEAKDPKP